MLKKTLLICTLSLCGMMGLQSTENEVSSKEKDNQQPQLVCKEKKDFLTCGKRDKKKDHSILVCGKHRDHFMLACRGKKKDHSLLACRGKKRDHSLLACRGKKKDHSILACDAKKRRKYHPQKLACEKKDLTPGALVCNEKEDKCTKDGEKKESPSSLLFAAFCNDHQDEQNLLACRNCR